MGVRDHASPGSYASAQFAQRSETYRCVPCFVNARNEQELRNGWSLRLAWYPLGSQIDTLTKIRNCKQNDGLRAINRVYAYHWGLTTKVQGNSQSTLTCSLRRVQYYHLPSSSLNTSIRTRIRNVHLNDSKPLSTRILPSLNQFSGFKHDRVMLETPPINTQ